MIKKSLLLLFLPGLFLHLVVAQAPKNDHCLQAISLGNAPICPSAEFTNTESTPSTTEVSGNPYCVIDGNNHRDVWFTFTTTAQSDYNIVVQSSGNRGILWPNVGVYRGDCVTGGLVKICADTLFVSEQLMSINVFGLSNRETYYIRISDEKGAGSFRICVTDFNPITFANKSSTDCAGILFDSGGPDNDYANNENSIFTICPEEKHNCIRFTISNYNIETGDSILFYNGPDTTAPLIRKIIGQDFNSGFNAGGAGFDVYASAPCLTVQFRSDSSGVYQGFVGKWLCSTEACPIFKDISLGSGSDTKTIEDAVARPGTEVKLTRTTCGDGKNNYGTFNATDNSDLGLGTGIVLSSGDIRKINQPANLLASTSLKLRGDADLDSLSLLEGGSISKDACVMEFDVFANTDEISFEYIFGSEEYPEFISDPTFYDIFALMIDGPGITGDPKIAPRKNLAVLPDGTPISIGQVSSGSNYEYYRNNFDGKEIVYNGLTTGKNGRKKTLTARTRVIPCNTYHLKLAIADRGDENFDSGVFIGDIKGSAPEITFSSALGLENLIESCSGTGEQIVFRLNAPATTPISYQVIFSGSATRGLDYESSVPSTITFPPGIADLRFPINVLSDNFIENDEYLEIVLLKNYGCGLNAVVSTKIFIKDKLQLQLNISDSIFLCKNTKGYDGKYLTVEGANRYLWQNESAFSNPYNSKTFFNPAGSGWYYVTGSTETCSLKDSFFVGLIQPELVIDTLDKTNICEGESIRLKATNNFGGRFLEWTPSSLFSNNKLESVVIKPKFPGQVVVKADFGSCTISDTLVYSVNKINMPVVTKYTEACYKEKVRLAAQTFAPGSTFSWSPSGPSNPASGDVFIHAFDNQKYILKGEANGCVAFDTAAVKIIGTVAIENKDTIRLCKGSKWKLKANKDSVINTAGFYFSWKSKAALFSAADSLQTNATALKSGWIYAEMISSRCTVRDSVLLLIDSLPSNTALTVVPTKPYYCQGDTLLLYSTSMPVSLFPDAKFQWLDTVVGAISSVNKANLKFTAEKSALYIRKTDNASCSRLDTIAISVLPKLPELRIDNDTICAGEIGTLKIKNASEYELFEWTPANSLSCSKCSSPTTGQPGLYRITASKSGYCPASKSISLTQKGVRLTLVSPKSIFCKNEKVEARITTSPAVNVSWSPADGLSCNNCPEVTVSKTGKYTAAASIDGCVSTSDLEIFQVTDSLMMPAEIRLCGDDVIKLAVPKDSLFKEFLIVPATNKSDDTILINQPGKYRISAKTLQGNCPVQHHLTASKGIIPEISISAYPQVLCINNSEVRLLAQGSNNLDLNSLVWQDNSSGTEYVAHPKGAVSNFIVRGSSKDGCPANDSITIYVVSAPSIFSPDSQTDNAVFKVLQLPPTSVADFTSLRIFDRWGNLVFETQNPEQSWNGDKFPSDVYLYYLTFDLKQEKKMVILTGDVTLIR